MSELSAVSSATYCKATTVDKSGPTPAPLSYAIPENSGPRCREEGPVAVCAAHSENMSRQCGHSEAKIRQYGHLKIMTGRHRHLGSIIRQPTYSDTIPRHQGHSDNMIR